MTLSDSDLKALRSRETRPATREGCLSAALLAAVTSGDLADADRGRVADHLAACSDCAEELRWLQPLQAWSERTAEAYGRPPRRAGQVGSWLRAWQLASMALVVAAGGLLAWNFDLRRHNADLIARAEIAPPVSVATPANQAPRPSIGGEVNVPIIDLQADALRGSGPPAAVAVVPADSSLVTLILNSDSRDVAAAYRLEVVDAAGAVVWHSEALTMTPFHTFTIALSPRALGRGLFHLRLFRLTGTQRETLETYSMRIEPR